MAWVSTSIFHSVYYIASGAELVVSQSPRVSFLYELWPLAVHSSALPHLTFPSEGQEFAFLTISISFLSILILGLSALKLGGVYNPAHLFSGCLSLDKLLTF